MLFFWFSMLPLCGILNLSLGSSRSIIPNCVRACTPCTPLRFHFLEYHVGVCNELLEFALCNSQSPASWIFFAAFSLRLLSFCESLVCTARPCNASFDQLRLSDGIGSKSHICKFDLGFTRIAQNVGVLIADERIQYSAFCSDLQ